MDQNQSTRCWEYECFFAVVLSYPRHKGFSKASSLGNDVVIPVSGLQLWVTVLQREAAAPAAQRWYLEVAENTLSASPMVSILHPTEHLHGLATLLACSLGTCYLPI